MKRGYRIDSQRYAHLPRVPPHPQRALIIIFIASSFVFGQTWTHSPQFKYIQRYRFRYVVVDAVRWVDMARNGWENVYWTGDWTGRYWGQLNDCMGNEWSRMVIPVNAKLDHNDQHLIIISTTSSFIANSICISCSRFDFQNVYLFYIQISLFIVGY